MTGERDAAEPRTEARLVELEIKASYADDLLDTLNRLVATQQQRIEQLERAVAALRAQAPEEAGAVPARDLRDDIPPHY